MNVKDIVKWCKKHAKSEAEKKYQIFMEAKNESGREKNPFKYEEFKDAEKLYGYLTLIEKVFKTRCPEASKMEMRAILKLKKDLGQE